MLQKICLESINTNDGTVECQLFEHAETKDSTEAVSYYRKKPYT